MSLKVLYVIDGLGTGGAERSLSEMLVYFREASIDPVVVCSYRRSEGVEQKIRAQGFDLRILNEHRTNSRFYEGFVGRVRGLRRIIAAERPDLIHTTLFQSNMLGRVAAVGTGVPVLSSVVSTRYDPVRFQNPDITRWKLRVVQLLDACTARLLTTHLHAITEAVKSASMRDLRVPASKITVVERGRTRERLGKPGADRRRRARQRLGLCEGDEVLLNVGRQEYPKGQRFLLEAMKPLVRERPNLVLLVAGRRGRASGALDRLRRHPDLEGQVRFLGHREDVPDLLAAADVFVFPSLLEGLGGAVIEAMALGLPVVASGVPALREVLEEGRNALLAAPGAPGELAQALRTLLDDPARREAFGKRSRAIFEERFTFEQSAKGIVDLYHKVAAL